MNFESPADLEAVRASYDAVADNCVTMVGDPGPWLRVALDAFAEEVREIGPVLDAGRGPGWISGYLHGKGFDVSGIDLSPRMIEQRSAAAFERLVRGRVGDGAEPDQTSCRLVRSNGNPYRLTWPFVEPGGPWVPPGGALYGPVMQP